MTKTRISGPKILSNELKQKSYVNRILESERGFVSNRQEENIKAMPDVTEEKTDTEIKIPKKYQDNI